MAEDSSIDQQFILRSFYCLCVFELQTSYRKRLELAAAVFLLHITDGMSSFWDYDTHLNICSMIQFINIIL